jgi:hypothetical protein
LNQTQAADVLLVRALEEADAHGELLDAETRAAAGREALRRAGIAAGEKHAPPPDELDACLGGRAEVLRKRLATRAPDLLRLRDAVLRSGAFAPLLVIAALALGVALGSLGAERKVSIVAFPLLGLIAWNLAVYAALAAGAMMGRKHSRSNVPWVGWLARAREWASAGLARHLPMGGPPEAVAAATGERFVRAWLKASHPIIVARAKTAFHLAAAALALGTVAGMYLRGLVFEYRAGWESTFLGADAVHALLAALLGPASAATGIPLPDAAHIAALRFGPEQPGENAAPWIHLYAATATIYVIVPRLLLAAYSAARRRQMTNDFPLDYADPYYRRIVAAAFGRTATLALLPYSGAPAPERLPALEQALCEALGETLKVTVQAPLAYGSEEEFFAVSPPPALAEADHVALLASLATTPEAEVHGALLAGLGKARKAAGKGDPVILLLDESTYRERLGSEGEAERRVRERLFAWRQLAETSGARVVSAGGAKAAA